MESGTNPESSVSAFCSLTGASASKAREYLEANRWDVSSAVTEYYTAQEEGYEGERDEIENAGQAQQPYTGPRTLDGRPAPASAIPSVASSSRSAPPPKRGGVATLDSLGQSSAASHGHNHDDDDDSDDEDFIPEGEPRDLFAGGEKSGLAVQDPSRNDPRKVVNDILKKARMNAARQGTEPAAPAPNTRFRGSGQTLGSDEVPSHVVADPTPRRREPQPIQTRVLHLWEDGFSVEDGPLRRFDDPQNAADLAMIRQGRAPLHLMNVRADQSVDVQLIKHEENYKVPPKVYKPFSGSGQRLGSQSPGGMVDTTPVAATPAAPTTTAPSVPDINVDATQPTINLRVQLADGTRLPARFNTTHTIGDVYGFIERASPASNNRPWVLATTFPSKDHTDKSLALGDVAEFKRGGTAVQKWT